MTAPEIEPAAADAKGCAWLGGVGETGDTARWYPGFAPSISHGEPRTGRASVVTGTETRRTGQINMWPLSVTIGAGWPVLGPVAVVQGLPLGGTLEGSGLVLESSTAVPKDLTTLPGGRVSATVTTTNMYVAPFEPGWQNAVLTGAVCEGEPVRFTYDQWGYLEGTAHFSGCQPSR